MIKLRELTLMRLQRKLRFGKVITNKVSGQAKLILSFFKKIYKARAAELAKITVAIFTAQSGSKI